MMILIFESSYQVKTGRRNASFIYYDSYYYILSPLWTQAARPEGAFGPSVRT